jgi:threonine dehydrogenase-like Zn-dependent dehydrogenase
MKALVVGKGHASLEDVPMPTPAPGEALIRVRQAGICGTDLEILKGYLDYHGVIGHEFVGKVETCGDPAWIGKRVVGELNCACHECPTCRRGHPRHCPNRTVLGIQGRPGAIATHVALPVRNLHEVPATVGDDHAVFTEPLAAALEILDQIDLSPTDEVLLLGDGRLAQLVGQVLGLTGCALSVSGKHRSKLGLLRKRGALTCLTEDLPDRKWDVVIEATGAPGAAELAVERCRPRGTVVLKSTVVGQAGVPVVPVVVDEITVVGSRCGAFAPALRLLASGRIEVSSLISGIYPLGRAKDALAYAQGRDVLKVLVDAVHVDG